jgi:hypothetical protein
MDLSNGGKSNGAKPKATRSMSELQKAIAASLQ